MPDIAGANQLHALCLRLKTIHRRLQDIVHEGSEIVTSPNPTADHDCQFRFASYFDFA
jgi:hypothetical protein